MLACEIDFERHLVARILVIVGSVLHSRIEGRIISKNSYEQTKDDGDFVDFVEKTTQRKSYAQDPRGLLFI